MTDPTPRCLGPAPRHLPVYAALSNYFACTHLVIGNIIGHVGGLLIVYSNICLIGTSL